MRISTGLAGCALFLALTACEIRGVAPGNEANEALAPTRAPVERLPRNGADVVRPVDPRGAVQNGLVLADLDTIRQGARVTGDLGPEIQASLATGLAALADIESWVACPRGVRRCEPGNLAADTLYTYVIAVTPGVDRTNDRPFAQPEAVDPVRNAMRFVIEGPLHGFTGKAGYSFGDARRALGREGGFTIACASGALVFTARTGGQPWSTGDTIRFYWQSVAPPGDPGQSFTLQADNKLARGPGARPVALQRGDAPESATANVPCG